jgi:VCBS repeat-containing protein
MSPFVLAAGGEQEMKRKHPHTDARPTLSGVIRAAALALIAAGALGAVPVFGDETGNPVTGPSAAGERLIMERAGLIPRTVRTPSKPSAPSAPGPAALVFGLDVLVNDPGTDTPESTTQSETSMAVLGNTICAGYNDSGANRYSGLARSTDLGATWTDLGEIGQRGDPVIAVHEDSGTFYYAEIATIGGNPAIGVAVSNDDCLSFAAPVDASPGASAIGTTALNDKPWIAVDNTGGANDGNIYVCWTRFDPGLANGSELRFSRSTDGGATYVNEQILAAAGTAPFGCSVAVGSDGAVNVSWADRTGATQNDIRFRRSTDAGVTFSAAISAATGNRHPGIDTVVACGLNNNRPTLTGNIRQLHQSWLAVDNTGGAFDGNLYLVWASDPVGTPDNADVLFSRSSDGGATWSAPVQLGIEAGPNFTDQFEPFVAVGGTGQVSVAWYDRRNDPANNNLIDVYKTFSQDGGATFDPIVRVTDENFAPPPILPNFDPNIGQCYMGEYIAVAADASNFYYMWGDNRNTLVTTNFPGGRPDPDIFFEAEAIPGLNTPPVAEDDFYNGTEDTLLSVPAPGVLANDSDADGDPLTAILDSGPSNGTLTLNADGSFTYDPDLNFCGEDSFTYHANDGQADSNIATVTIDVACVNDAPVATDNAYTHDEDTQLTGNVITDDTGAGVDSDADGDALSINSNTDVAHGTLVLNPDGSFTYDPNLNYCGPDGFTYDITDDPPATPPPLVSNTATVSITVTCVNDPPEVTNVDPASQTSDYSDYIGTVTITVEDVDDISTTLAESNEPPASAGSLALTSTGCVVVPTESPAEDGSVCTFTYDGQVLDPGDNAYGIVFTPSDPDGPGTVTGTHTLTIQPEDATVTLDPVNPIAIEVPEEGGDSGPFALFFSAIETSDPDDPNDGTAEFGDLNNMSGFMTLAPVGPGGPITVACSLIPPLPAYPAEGYGQVAVFQCDFDAIPVNTYEVLAEVDGLSDTTRYYVGFDEGVLVIYDPSLGFITGGGWFLWPDSDDPALTACGPDGYAGDRTNIGFNFKYNKGKKKKPQGNLLLMRHTVDAACADAGSYKVKSNALDGMSVGDGTDADGEYGWATVLGKATFREPGLEDEGNHTVLLYTEDYGEQGCNQDPSDEFWIQVKDKDGVIVLEINGDDPAGPDTETDGDDEPLVCGNIVIPHETGGKDKP